MKSTRSIAKLYFLSLDHLKRSQNELSIIYEGKKE